MKSSNATTGADSAAITLEQFLTAKKRRLQEDQLFLQSEKLRIEQENQQRMEEYLREETARRQARLELVKRTSKPFTVKR
jgi:hypothetical protein